MARKLFLYLVVLAILIGGAPYLTGMLVETKFQDVVRVFSEVDSLPLTIEVTDYHRGWLTSTAKTRLTFFLNRQGQPVKKYNFILEHEIQHGPFVHTKDGSFSQWHLARGMVHSKLLLSDEAKQILTAELGNTELFNINSEMELSGAVEIKVDGKPLKLKEQEGTERVAWKGLQANWQINREMNHLKGEVLLPGFDIDWNHIHFFAQGLVYKTDLFKSAEGLWPGKFTGSLEQLKLENPIASFGLRINGLTTGGVMDVENAKADFSGTVNIEKLYINDKEYGPIVYSNSLKNIASNVIKVFFELTQKIRTGEPTQSTSYMHNLITLIPDLLKTRPEFNIEQIQVHTAQGDVIGFLNFAVGGPEASDVNNIPVILQSIAAKASISLPKVLLRDLLVYQYTKTVNATNEVAKAAAQMQQQQTAAQTPAQTPGQTPGQTTPAPNVDPNLPKVLTEQEIAQEVDTQVTAMITKWVQSGTLVEQGDHYVIVLEFLQSKLKVNGQAIELPGKTGLDKIPSNPEPTMPEPTMPTPTAPPPQQ